MALDDVLKVKAQFDRQLIWNEGGSVRYLLVDIQAADTPQADRDRPVLNLALVVDVSGSMTGAPLGAAKQAAHGIVDTLRPDDRLSIVTFESSTEVVLESVSLGNGGKDAAHRAIDRMQTRGCTNLAAGWLDGAECVARDMAALPDAMHRVLVLSDGHANRGECNPVKLSEIAEGLRERGVLSSCVGIGDHYSPIQLQAICEPGGGRLHDAQHPQEITEVVSAELETICQTVAEDVTVILDGPDDLGVEPFGFYPCRTNGRQIELSVGSLLPGASRRVAVKFTCLKKREQVHRDRFDVTVKVACQDMLTGDDYRTRSTRCTLIYARGRDNSAQPRDEAVSLAVARIWQAHVLRQATQMNLDSAFGRAHQYLRHQLRYFDRYCRGLPGGDVLVGELRRTMAAIDRPWSPRSSKEVIMFSTRQMRSEPDHRSLKRPHWSSYVGT